MTRKYWESVGGTLIEEFPAVRAAKGQRKRHIDGVVILGGEREIIHGKNVDRDSVLRDREVVVIQTKKKPLGMLVLGQALFSRELILSGNFGVRSARTVAIVTSSDAVLEPLAAKFGVEIAMISGAAKR